jgi:hypothetical protein
VLYRAQAGEYVASMVGIGVAKRQVKKKKVSLTRSGAPGRKGGREGDSLRAWFVPEPAALGRVLAAAEDVTDHTFSAEQAMIACLFHRRIIVYVLSFGSLLRAAQAGLDQGPASTDPVAVASVNKFIRATREAAFWGVLSGRDPRDESWNIEVARYMPECISREKLSLLVGSPPLAFLSVVALHAPLSCLSRRRGQRKKKKETYRGTALCGESRIDRQPRAQKAYAPWASVPGLADTPPSYVWPRRCE